MSGESSTAISHPGHDWRMRWIDGGLDGLQLDIVGFLAILGEESVKKTTRLASLSRLFWLPRLMPAPHCLLYTERQENLEAIPAVVSSVQSGRTKQTLRHVTAAMFPTQLASFEVRCFRIRSRKHDDGPADLTKVKAALTGPVILVNLFGCILSATLLILSFVFGDGMSLIATLLLSLLSTLIGITNHWGLSIPARPSFQERPDDVVIRLPNGSYLIIKANEDVTRELFFMPDSIAYTLTDAAQFIPTSIIGTITLMLSVIALANAKIQLQLAWAVAFILLNIGHWIAAALPRSYNFSFPGYEIEEEYLSVGSRASNFTEALWRAIFLARDVEWVRRSESAPATEVWMNWLAEAERLIKEPPITVQQKDDPHPQRAWKLRRSSTWRMKSGSPRTVHHIPEWSPRESWNRLNGAYQIREAAHQTLSSKV